MTAKNAQNNFWGAHLVFSVNCVHILTRGEIYGLCITAEITKFQLTLPILPNPKIQNIKMARKKRSRVALAVLEAGWQR